VVNFHLKLNTTGKLIANKYREGKLKTTLKRELKEVEAYESEAFGVSVYHISSFFSVLFFCFSLKKKKGALNKVKLGKGGGRHLERF